MKIESDRAIVWGGIRHGRTLGSPIALLIENRDYANWEERMNPWPVRGGGRRGAPAASGPRRPRRDPQVRPHRRAQRARAGQRARDGGAGGGRRAREGVPARVRGRRSTATCCRSARSPRPSGPSCGRRTSPESTSRRSAASTPARATRWSAEIDRARKANESLGGIFEVRAFGAVPGLGSYMSWDGRLDGRLARAVMSIHAMKGVAIGDGFDAGRAGSARRLTTRSSGTTTAATSARRTAPAGSRAA